MTILSEFKRSKDFLICVDSDGCAMDTMDIKHIRCFGPCLVEEWNLEQWADQILARWNEINLYTMTRGINRFKGLAMALEEINRTICPVDGVEEFTNWVKNASELSNPALEHAALTAAGPCFTKALSWSQKVNEGINALPDSSKKPYDYVLEGLAAAHEFADVAVVSSANREAVVEEWERCDLLEHVDVVCCQDAGSKAHCINILLQQEYAKGHVLMVGDAPGDQEAASKNNIYYYPILVKKESQSWLELKETGLQKFLEGSYEDYGIEKSRQFLENLGAR